MVTPPSGAAEFAPTPEELDRLFPDLEILKLLGAGGMGAVYQARQPRLDRIVALKVLSCAPEMHDSFALRFEREAQLLAKLHHPHIVTLFDFGEIPDGPGGRSVFYFLMEYIGGGSLEDRLRSGDEIRPRHAFRLVSETCEALAFAHGKGILHRDIKPANLLIDSEGRIRVADFGIAKILEDEEAPLMTGLTVTGTTMGTPHYMAPELWEDPTMVDRRADLYSVGVVFYQLLTGEKPAGVFEEPSRIADVERMVDNVVFKALEKNRERRYQDAEEMRLAVERVAARHRQRVRRRRVKTALALGGVGMAVGLAWWVWQGTKDVGEPGIVSRPSVKPAEVVANKKEQKSGKDSDLSHLAPRSSPGRLRSWGVTSGGGAPDLSMAEGIDDFVQVARSKDSWIALRENGDLVQDGKGVIDRNVVRLIDKGGGALGIQIAYLKQDGSVNFCDPAAAPVAFEFPLRHVFSFYNEQITHVFGIDREGRVHHRKTAEATHLSRQADDSEAWRSPPPEASTGVASISMSMHIGMVAKEDGSFLLWNVDGLVLEAPEGTVSLALTAAHAFAVLGDGSASRLKNFDQGTKVWTALALPRSAESVHAAGSTVVFRDGAGEYFMAEGEDSMAAESKDGLDHLRGLPEEAWFFSAYEGSLARKTLVWIEPRPDDTPTAVSSQLFTYAEPGPLKHQSFGEDSSLSLARAEGIDDFVQVRVQGSRWYALREDGTLVHSDLGEVAKNVRAIPVSGSGTQFYLTDDWVLKNMTQSQPAVPLSDDLRDVVISKEQGSDYYSILLVDGSGAVRHLAAPRAGYTPAPGEQETFEAGDWRRPPEMARTGAVGVQMTQNVTLVELTNGRFVVWGPDREPALSPENTISAAISPWAGWALLDDGRLITTGNVVELGRSEWTEYARLEDAEHLQIAGVELIIRMRDGSYRSREPDSEIGRGLELPLKKIVELPPATWEFSAYPDTKEKTLRIGNLVWIEPPSEDSSTAVSSPLFTYAEPGRLRAHALRADEGFDLDFSAVASFDDFVQVGCYSHGGGAYSWIGLRENGQLHMGGKGLLANEVVGLVRQHGNRMTPVVGFVTSDGSAFSLLSGDFLRKLGTYPNLRDIAIHRTDSNTPNPDFHVYLVREDGTADYQILDRAGIARDGVGWAREFLDSLEGCSHIMVRHDDVVLAGFENETWEIASKSGRFEVFAGSRSATLDGGAVHCVLESGSALGSGPLDRLEEPEWVERQVDGVPVSVFSALGFPLYLRSDGSYRFFSELYGRVERLGVEGFDSFLDPVTGRPVESFCTKLSIENRGEGDVAEQLVLVWIEPPSGDSPTEVSSPLFTYAEPGSLQSWSASSTGDPAFDLVKAEGIDDFVQVMFRQPGIWVGLRENGELIDSEDGRIATGVRALVAMGDRQTSDARAYLTRDNVLHALRINDNIGPDPIEIPSVRDLAVVADGWDRHVYLVGENGDLEYRCWGPGDNDARRRSDLEWRLVPNTASTGIVEVTGNHLAVMARREDGSFAAWTRDGPVDVPGDVVSLSVRHNRLIGVTGVGGLIGFVVGNSTGWETSEGFWGSAPRIVRVFGGDDFPLFECAEGGMVLPPVDFPGRPFLEQFRNPLAGLQTNQFAWFLRQQGQEFQGGFLWIESGKTPSDVLDLTTLPRGRLRQVGTGPQGEAGDFSQATYIDDFVAVAGSRDFWVGLRANGETVSSDGSLDVSGIRKLCASFHTHAVLIDKNGQLHFREGNDQSLPDSMEGIRFIDAQVSQRHGIALDEDGRAHVFGESYETDFDDGLGAGGYSTPRWPAPLEEALTGVQAVAVANTHAATLKEDGSLRVFGWEGLVDLPPEVTSKSFIQIASSPDQVCLLDSEGRAWRFGLARNPHRNQPVGHAGKLLRMGLETATAVGNETWRDEDGRWHSVENQTDQLLDDHLPGDVPHFTRKWSTRNDVNTSLLWVEVNAEKAEAAPRKPALALAIPPPLAMLRERGGRLRSWSAREEKVTGLELAEGMDDFVRLDGFAGFNPDCWLAIRSNGPSVTSLTDFERAGELVSLNSHLGVLRSGEIVKCYGDHQRRVLPGSAIGSGYGHAPEVQFEFVLNRSGRILFRRAPDFGNWHEDEFPRVRERLEEVDDAVKIAAGSNGSGILLRASGEVIAWNKDGPWPSDVEFDDAVDIAIDGVRWMALLSDGTIHAQCRPGESHKTLFPPEDLGTAYAIRAFGNVAAAQMSDGSWRAWGPERYSRLIGKIESLGPVADILFRDSEKGDRDHLLWIEPRDADEAVENFPVLEVPPALKVMRERGGRLRAWTAAEENVLELELAEGIDDFVQLDGVLYPGSDRWLAIRRDGPSITPLPDFKRSGELVSLDTHLGVLRSGEIVETWQDTRKVLPGNAAESGYAGHGVQFELFRNRDGTVTLNRAFRDGQWFERDGDRILQILDGVEDAVKIDTGPSKGIVLRASGELIAWNDKGLWPPDPPITDAVDVAMAANFWAAVRADGTMRVHPPDASNYLSPDDLPPVYSVRTNGVVAAAQLADGSWRAWGGNSNARLIEQINTMGPAVDLLFFSQGHGREDALLWIEPTSN